MIIKLASGKDIVIDDVARDPRVEGIDWLREYRAKRELKLKARRQAVPGSIRRYTMGLANDIQTLQIQYESDPGKGQELAKALAEMISRKNSKRLIEANFYELTDVLYALGRGDELDAAAGGIDARRLGSWDKQAVAKIWLAMQ